MELESLRTTKVYADELIGTLKVKCLVLKLRITSYQAELKMEDEIRINYNNTLKKRKKHRTQGF